MSILFDKIYFKLLYYKYDTLNHLRYFVDKQGYFFNYHITLVTTIYHNILPYNTGNFHVLQHHILLPYITIYYHNSKTADHNYLRLPTYLN